MTESRATTALAAGTCGASSQSGVPITRRSTCYTAHLVSPDLFEGVCVVQLVFGEAVQEGGHLYVLVRSDEPVGDEGAQEREFAGWRVEVGRRCGGRTRGRIAARRSPVGGHGGLQSLRCCRRARVAYVMRERVRFPPRDDSTRVSRSDSSPCQPDPDARQLPRTTWTEVGRSSSRQLSLQPRREPGVAFHPLPEVSRTRPLHGRLHQQARVQSQADQDTDPQEPKTQDPAHRKRPRQDRRDAKASPVVPILCSLARLLTNSAML